MARRNYTDEQKAAVLARVEEVGIVAASKEAGIDRKTVSNWAKAAKPKETEAKVETAPAAAETDVKPAEKKPEKPKQAVKKENETKTVATGRKVKGETKVSEKKNDSKAKFPGRLPFVPNKEWFEKLKNSKSTDEFKDNIKSAWEKTIEMQKSSMEGAKKQWNQSFDYLQDMQEKFVDSLPQDTKFPVPRKEFFDEMKKFQEMSKAHFEEQMDSAVDFYFKGQEQFFGMVCAACEKKGQEKEAE